MKSEKKEGLINSMEREKKRENHALLKEREKRMSGKRLKLHAKHTRGKAGGAAKLSRNCARERVRREIEREAERQGAHS